MAIEIIKQIAAAHKFEWGELQCREPIQWLFVESVNAQIHLTVRLSVPPNTTIDKAIFEPVLPGVWRFAWVLHDYPSVRAAIRELRVAYPEPVQILASIHLRAAIKRLGG